MRRPFIGGNWKMYLDRKSGVELSRALVKGAAGVRDRDILICPAFPLLSDIGRELEGSSIRLGAQNVYFEKEGAFTGEVSTGMIKSCGCTHAIIGHSERRHIFGEGNDLIHRKLLAALAAEVAPVFCVGELLKQREEGRTEEVVEEQVTAGLEGIGQEDLEKIVVAYEPVWAIGTGKTATPEDANSVHRFIRSKITDIYSRTVAEDLRIIYGGSVKPDNIDALMAMEHIDGALVGGASLKADSFLRIVKFI
jgi:triosephosphate isomerase